MALEGIEVAQAGRAQDRRSEGEVGGIEDGVVIGAQRLEAVEQLAHGLHPQSAPQVVVERGDRLAEEHAVVGKPIIGLGGPPSGDLQIEPAQPFGVEGGDQPIALAGRRVQLADVGKSHLRQAILGGGC